MRLTFSSLAIASCLLLSLLGPAYAQNVACSTLSNGCDGGKSHDTAVKAAIARFEANRIYGGDSSSPVVFSSASGGSSLAFVSYACNDGVVPPIVTGSTIQSLLSPVVSSCANQCGSAPLPQNDKCGVALVIADNSTSYPCFSKAINVVPTGKLPKLKSAEGQWTSLSCWTDSDPDNLSIQGNSTKIEDMTVSRCLARAKGFRYAGVESASQCYWGNEIGTKAKRVDSDECAVSCEGLVTEACGASKHIIIYENLAYEPPPSSEDPSSPVPTATVLPSVESFQSPSCYIDGSSPVVLTNGSSTRGDMTVEDCIELADGWRYAGLENGSDCLWGDLVVSSQQTDQAECTSGCAGKATVACGAKNRLLVYEDSEFDVPTRSEIADIVSEYVILLGELEHAIRFWNDLISMYFDEGGEDVAIEGDVGFAKRDLFDLIPQIRSARQVLLGLRGAWKTLSRKLKNAATRGHRYQRIPDINPSRLTELGDDVMGIFSQVQNVASRTMSQWGQVAMTAGAAIGTRTGGQVLGLFASAGALYALLKGPDPQDPQDPTHPPGQTPAVPEVPTPCMCEIDTCDEGDVCPAVRDLVLRELGRRAPPLNPPADIVTSADTTQITNSQVYSDWIDCRVTVFLTPQQWWRAIKRLVWEHGSQHGLHFLANGFTQARPSSVYVPFTRNPHETLITGAGPVWGCTSLIVITNRGVYTTHWWQNPFFENANGAQFRQRVLDFLRNGDDEQHQNGERYLGLYELVQAGGPFFNVANDAAMGNGFLWVGLMTPQQSRFVQGQGWVAATNPPRPMYMIEVHLIRDLVAEYLGIRAADIHVRPYAYDNGIWVNNGNPNDRPSLDRSVRVDEQQWRGMMTVQRLPNPNSLVTPAVRVFFEDDEVFRSDPSSQ